MKLEFLVQLSFFVVCSSVEDCSAIHCTDLFIIILILCTIKSLPSSRWKI